MDRPGLSLIRFLEFLEVCPPELSRNLSVPAPDPFPQEFPRHHLRLYSMCDRRKVQTTASPHWGLQGTVLTPRDPGTVSRNAATRRCLTNLPCGHSLNSPQSY
jgi:hypothetical protein